MTRTKMVNMLGRPSTRLQLFLLFGLGIVVIAMKIIKDWPELDRSVHTSAGCCQPSDQSRSRNDGGTLTIEPNQLVYYNNSTPLIWVGGVPRSGTTLARAMLDAHPDVRCGEETSIIPVILSTHKHFVSQYMEWLEEAQLSKTTLNKALGAYLLSIIANHGEPAPRLCNKDPFALNSMKTILEIFPNSTFLLMIRDGRATVHSVITRNVTIGGWDMKTYRGALKNWNKAIHFMYSQCLSVGPLFCLPMYYEQLVLHPETEMRRILQFMDVPWNDLVLHHEQTIGQAGGVSLSK